MNKIETFVKRLDQFDYNSVYSDDMKVWKASRVAERNLMDDIVEAELTDEEKQTIIEMLTELNDTRYLKNKAMFSCIADTPLWADGDLNFKKRAVIFILGMNKV